jgi:hypothetical protein
MQFYIHRNIGNSIYNSYLVGFFLIHLKIRDIQCDQKENKSEQAL